MTAEKVSVETSSHKLLVRLVLPSECNGLESVGLAAPAIKAQERLEAARGVLGSRVAMAPDVDGEVFERLLKDAKEGLRKLESCGDDASLEPAEVFGLEAVIESDGSRPVLFVQDGTIDVKSPDLTIDLGKHWKGAAISFLQGIRSVAASVGAIQLPAFHNKRSSVGQPIEQSQNDVADFRQYLQRQAFPALRVRRRVRPEMELNHDCLTLGGNTGSSVIDLATHKFVGLNFSGCYGDRGHPVVLSKLTKDG